MGRDGVAGLACMAGALVLLAETRGLPQASLVPVGPAFYPRIVLGITIVLGAALVVADLRRRRTTVPPVSSVVTAPSSAPGYRLVVLTFVMFWVYVGLLPILGYRIDTFLFVGGLQAMLERPRGRRWGVVLVMALATTVVTYYAFEVYLSVLLPRGRLTGF